jgi:DNA-3-methyladenine glycosylase II
MKNALNRNLIKKAVKHLSSADGILAEIIETHGPCTMQPVFNNPFHALVSSIVSQQLSVHAARAIKGRLFEIFGEEMFTPDRIISKLSVRNVRSAGLSRAKYKYIHELALAANRGRIDFGSIANSDDESVIEKLTAFSGIGRWTAEMFLIFGLGRPDVLSTKDAGLRRGFKILYNLQEPPSEAEMISISEPWKPYRSVASWYLWRVVD